MTQHAGPSSAPPVVLPLPYLPKGFNSRLATDPLLKRDFHIKRPYDKWGHVSFCYTSAITQKLNTKYIERERES